MIVLNKLPAAQPFGVVVTPQACPVTELNKSPGAQLAALTDLTPLEPNKIKDKMKTNENNL